MIILGDEPARLLALELLRVENIPAIYGPLYLENVANCLLGGLGARVILTLRGKGLGLAAILGQAPRTQAGWHKTLQRELANPYGDDKVFRRLDTLEAKIPWSVLGEARCFLGGNFCDATFSAHSNLNIAVIGQLGQTDPDGEIHLHLTPTEPASSLPLPSHTTLPELYWQVLQARGFDLTPRPRVVGFPARHRVPDGPLKCLPLDRSNNPSSSFRRAACETDTPSHYQQLAADLAQRPLPWLKIREGQSPAKLFFAVVRWLGPHPLEPQAFRAWCQERRRDIEEQLETRCLQVNSVRRAAYLVAGLGWVAQRWGRPMRLLEVGASAGLLLNFEHYYLDFGTQALGPSTSLVQIRCLTTGDLPNLSFELKQRIGLDLRPLSAQDPEDCRWLECQSWSSKLLSRALQIAREYPPKILAHDILQGLPDAGKETDALQVIFHSHCWNQLSRERQQILESSSQREGVVRLSLEWEDALHPLLRAHWQEGQQLLASCPRGQMEWLAEPRGHPEINRESAIQSQVGGNL